MNELIYSFGLCLYKIISNGCLSYETINEYSPFLWQKHNSFFDYKLILKSEYSHIINRSEKQWEVEFVNGNFVYSYNVNHIRQFSLSFNRNEIEICANPKFEKNFKLGIQFAVMITQLTDTIGVHAVTVLCGKQVVLLSAPSGTGKTTLSELLKKNTRSVVINGDFAMLSIDKCSKVIFEPTPFCGTSKISRNTRLYVDRIVFLEQASYNRVETMSTREACVKFLSNVFVPTWDINLTNLIEQHIFDIVEKLKIEKFAFRPEPQAAEMLFNHINTNL